MLPLVLLLACRPSPPSLTLTKPATSADDLVVEPPPEVGEHFTYRWAVDDTVQPDLLDRTVPASRTERGERWSVEVVRVQGRRRSKPVQRSTRILNGPPSVEARIVHTTDGLLAVPITTDPDGDAVALDASWVRDGTVRSRVLTVGWPLLETGQEWLLTLVPDDGEVTGEPVEIAYTVGELPARLDAAAIEPDPLTALDEATLQLFPEPAGGVVEATWFADGVHVHTGASLPRFTVSRGQSVYAEVIVDAAGIVVGPTVTPAVRVANTPPQIDDALIVPEVLTEALAASCTVEGWLDADGDPEGVRAQWYVNEVLTHVGLALGGSDYDRGDSVRCLAFPTDGESEGEPQWSQTVEIGNVAPALSALVLEPAAPVTGDPVHALAEGAFDLDGDAVDVAIDWFVDGLFVGSGEILPVSVIRGQLLEATAVPDDGLDEGEEVYAIATEVGNAGPQVVDAAYLPDPPRAGQPLRLDVTFSDAEGDLVQSTRVRWFVDGTELVADEVPGADLTAGIDVYAQVQGNDGLDSGPRVTLPTVTVAP